MANLRDDDDGRFSSNVYTDHSGRTAAGTVRMCRDTPDNVGCYSQQRRALAEGSMKSARVCRTDGCADDHVTRQLMIARQTKTLGT